MSAQTLVRALVAAACVWLMAESPALACSVCVGAETPDTRNAWIAMTAFMTFTPLSIVVGVAFWLRHRFKTLDAADRDETTIGRMDGEVATGSRSS